MNKNNLIHSISGIFVLLLTIAPCMCFAQKTVTYTFTGRNASSITSTSSKPLGLYVSDGTAPKGVSIDNISGVSSDESENGIDNVDIGNTVGISLIPQYLVRPGEEGVITFKNFLYEIASINWTSRSQVPLLTSKTSTWAVKGDGSSKTNTLTKEWDSNTYETSPFVTDQNFAGISALHISCETTQALHGHSMKDFIISYYEPEITITAPENIALSSSGTFSAAISNHAGAFTNAMLTVTATTTDGATVSLNDDNYSGSITSGTTVGAVILTAKLTYEGTVIATATKKVQIGQFDFEFVQRDLYCDYYDGSDPTKVHAYWKLYDRSSSGNNWNVDTNSGLRLDSEYTYNTTTEPTSTYWWTQNSNYLDYTNSTSGKITNIYTPNKTNYTRACLQRIDYNQFVPAYSVVSVPISFVMSSTRTSSNPLASAAFGIAMYNFGQGSDQIWPDQENLATSSTYKYFSCCKSGDWTSNTTQEPLIGNGGASSDVGSSKTEKLTVSTTFTFTNTDNIIGYEDTKMTQQLGAYSYVEHSLSSRTNSINSTFDYSNRSKTITYYLYINYDNNGGSGTMDFTEASSTDTNANGTVAANSFTKDADDKYTYEFVSWNTKADGTGTTYNAGDGINIYNSEGKCGAGPITLYAQWKATPKATESTTPSEDDNVYSLWGNGGTINGEEVIAAQFVLGATASNVTCAERTGYTFNGYYTSTTGGTQIFNASGVAVGDGIIISSTGRWMAENDVYLYAQWTENPSDPVTTITVTLDANGGSLAGASTITCTDGSSENCNIATQTPTRDGYKFTGWYTSSAGNVDGDIMVYNANGEAVYVESYSTDSEGNITPVYTALNPTFFSTSGKYVGETAPFNADFTIYAHWIANTTTMTFNEGGTTANSASWTDGTNTGDFSSTPTYDEVEYNSVTITRTLNAVKWNTVCFPFNVSKAKVAELFSDVEMFSGLKVEGTSATMLFEKCDVMMPGVPYFVKIKNSSNLSELTLSNVTVSKTPSPIKISNGNTTVEMIGEFNTHLNIEAGALFLLNSKFYVSGGTYNGKKVTGNNKGFRCYFKNTTIEPSGAKSCNLFSTSIDLEGYDGYDGYATDVEQFEINPDNCTFSIAQEEIYDLSGRKLAGKPEKGIYLTNGRKYIAR